MWPTHTCTPVQYLFCLARYLIAVLHWLMHSAVLSSMIRATVLSGQFPVASLSYLKYSAVLSSMIRATVLSGQLPVASLSYLKYSAVLSCLILVVLSCLIHEAVPSWKKHELPCSCPVVSATAVLYWLIRESVICLLIYTAVRSCQKHAAVVSCLKHAAVMSCLKRAAVLSCLIYTC